MVTKQTSTANEIQARKSRLLLKQKLADLLDYMDTLDRKTWDDLGLYKLYNTGLDTFNGLYSHPYIDDSKDTLRKMEDNIDEEIY